MARWPSFSYLGDVPEEFGYYVYEFWADDVCLYVGRVGNNGPGSVRRRFASHASASSTSSAWWSQATRVLVSRFSSHEEIVAEEPRRIQELRPVHNRQFAWLAKVDAAVPANTAEREDVYQAEYRQQPERKAREQQRARGRDWQEFNARAADRKKRWTASRVRRPSPGQTGLF